MLAPEKEDKADKINRYIKQVVISTNPVVLNEAIAGIY